MRVRKRPDGVTELLPENAPLEPFDRFLVIATVVMITGGMFVVGVMPAPVLATILAGCLAGEVVLGAKAIVLALLRPLAEVHEIPRWALRQRIQ